jgi:hypothetical protein
VVLLSGERSPTSLFPGCPGTAHGTVTYNVPSDELSSAGSFGPIATQRAHTVTVGRFTYDNP